MPQAVLESPDEKVTGVSIDQDTGTEPLTGGTDPIFAPSDTGAGDIAKISKEAGNIADTKASDDARIIGSSSANIEESRIKAHTAYDAEAATSHDIPSWDEDKQKQKFSTDPVKAFGSVGSVFAMIAAAFTHRPMINALQGSAAAMDAIRAGNEEDYKHAYTAWKDNTDLAIKRHDMMHQEYADAVNLMATDAAAGRAQLDLAATKYKDNKIKLLADNGMDEDVIKVMDTRARAMDQIKTVAEGDMDHNLKMQAFRTDARVASGNPQQILAAWNQAFGKQVPTAEQTAVANYVSTTPPPTDEQSLEKYNAGLEDIHKKFATTLLRAGQVGTQTGYMATRVPELMEAHKDDPAYTIANAQIDADKEWQEAQKSATKVGRVYERAKEIQKQNPDMTPAAAQAQARLESVTGGKNYTKADLATIVNAPDLMDAMNTLYEMGDVTGLTTGKLSMLAAEYATSNDPAAIWAVAHRKAEAALVTLEGSGKASVKSIGIILDRIPKVYQSSGFNRELIADSMQSFAANTQSELNLQVQQGKGPLDEETLDRYNKLGIFLASQANRDPVQILRKDPTSLSPTQLDYLQEHSTQLTPKDLQDLRAVLERKNQEWLASRKRKPKPAAASPVAPLDMSHEATVE